MRTNARTWAPLAALASGLLFGVGLGISGMARPAKVLGFLDVTRAWDPSLAFVMMGAVGVYAVAVRIAKREAKPALSDAYHLPTATVIDAPLILGAILFGVGWGLCGYCPGPAILGAASGNTAALVFVIAMIAGMLGRQVSAQPAASAGTKLERS